MARSTFGGTNADGVFSTYTLGAKQLLALSTATLTFWDAETDGTQYTDLLLNGSPVESISCPLGQVPAFEGPDSVTEMWADDGDGTRSLMVAQGRQGPAGPEGPAGAPGGSDASFAAWTADDASETAGALGDAIASDTHPLGVAAKASMATEVETGSARPVLDVNYLDRPLRGHLFTTRNAAPVFGIQVMATNMTSRLRFVPRAAASDLRFVFANWATGSIGDGYPTGTVIFKASVESNGYTFPLTFNGRVEATIDAGYVISDPIAIRTTPGQGFYVRTFVTAASAQPRATAYAIGTDGEGRSAGDHTPTVAISADVISAFNTYAWGPSAVLTAPVPGSEYRAIGITGDSVAYGSGDTPISDGTGFLVRAAERDQFPYIMAARSGETTATSIDANYRWRGPLLSCVSHVVSEVGRNSVTNLPQMQTELLTWWRKMQSRGPKVMQTTITPHTNSTDAWATTANQTVANTGQESVRVALNTWLRDGAPVDPSTLAAVAAGAAGLRAGEEGHPLLAVIEVADSVEAARNSGIWKANYTADGLHPTATGHAAMAAAVDFTSLLA